MDNQEMFEQRRMELADRILAHPNKFKMSLWGYRTSCGTVGCLAGHAALQAEDEGLCTISWLGSSFDSVALPNEMRKNVDDFARDYLGLPNRNLFYQFSLTPETAAKALLEAPYRHSKES